MNSRSRGIAVLFAAIAALAFCLPAFGSTERHGAKEPASLPFTVNLAPGDVLVHGADRGVNSSDSYEQHEMVEGDRVIGSIGKLRSVILTGDASAVEVLPGSTLTASVHGGRAYLDLNTGTTRVGRASAGDGTPIRLLVRTRQVGAVVHGGDVVVSKSSPNTATLVQPEPDGRYLFSGRVSLLPLGMDGMDSQTVIPSPTFSYDDSGVVVKHLTIHEVPVTVHVAHYHHYRHYHHHRHHHRAHHHHRSARITHIGARAVSVRVSVRGGTGSMTPSR